jgi:ABC-type branched-subunit amino acid transport system substrate-binding protein
LNAQLVLTEYISPRAIDVSSNVAHILDANPDMVILATTDQLQPAILKELKASKFDMGKIVNSQHEGLGLLELLGLAKEVYEGTYEVTTQNYTDQTTEAYKTYQARQSKYATRWAGDTLMHFTSVMVLLDAIDRAQAKAGKAPISGAAVHAEMRSGTFKGYGLLNNIKFDSDTDPTLGADSVIMLRQLGGKVSKASDFLPLEK